MARPTRIEIHAGESLAGNDSTEASVTRSSRFVLSSSFNTGDFALPVIGVSFRELAPFIGRLSLFVFAAFCPRETDLVSGDRSFQSAPPC